VDDIKGKSRAFFIPPSLKKKKLELPALWRW